MCWPNGASCPARGGKRDGEPALISERSKKRRLERRPGAPSRVTPSRPGWMRLWRATRCYAEIVSRRAARLAVPDGYGVAVRLPLVALCVALVASVAPAASRAATVAVGSDLRGTVTVDNGCEAVSCTRTLSSLGGVEVRSPIDGVVVRWRAVGTGIVHL